MKLSIQTLTLIFLALTPAFTLAIPQLNKENSHEICVSSGDCYPKEFIPTVEWQIIKEGQVIPAGLDIQMDWQTSEKRAKLPDGVDTVEELNRLVDEYHGSIDDKGLQLVEEDDPIISYDDDANDDADILALKQAATGSTSVIDITEALNFLKYGDFNNKELLVALESLNEYSHSLKDGVRITLEENLQPLLQLAYGKSNYHEKELSLRIIAQSLRHNLKALANINATSILTQVFTALDSETNSVIQKRYLGLISSILQTEETVEQFIQLDGVKRLLKDFSKLKEDSKIRTLEILEDVKTIQKGIMKRDEDDDLDLYNTLENSLISNSITQSHHVSKIFNKLSELKKSHPEWKPTSKEFLDWLINDIERQSLQKRDGVEEYDEELHQRMKEDRHLIFGNPNALRKAFDDEF